MRSDYDIKKDFDCDYDDFYHSVSPYLTEAMTDFDFYLGRQWSDEEIRVLKSQGRLPFVYNYLYRNISMMSGYERKNRLGFGVDPVDNKTDPELASMLDAGMIWQAQNSNFYNVKSDAFEDALITGISWLNFWLDDSKDPVNSDIRTGYETFSSMAFDPMFRQLDLSDCRFLSRRKFMTNADAAALIPSERKAIMNMKGGYWDNKFWQMVHPRREQEDFVAYDEYWKRTRKKMIVTVDDFTGEVAKWPGLSEENVRQLTREVPWIQVREIYQPSVEYHVFVNGNLVHSGDELTGIDDYPFTPIVAVYKPTHPFWEWKLQGVIRDGRDAQMEYNRKRSKMSAIIDTTAYSGWMAEEGAVKNEDDLYDPSPKVFMMNKGRMGGLQKIPSNEIPQSIIQLAEMLKEDMLQIPGLNESALGVDEGGNTEVSGALAKMRANNSVTVLKKIYDNAELSQKLFGSKMLKAMVRNYTPQKWARITGKPMSDLILQQDWDKYDVVVKETLLTDTQRTLNYYQALEAKKAGINVPQKFVLENMPIANHAELMESFAEEAKMAAEQQAKINEQEIMRLKLANAEVVHKLSLGEMQRETAVQKQALAAQELANAEASRAKSNLDNIKAVKEIEGMDTQNLIKSLSFLLSLEQSKANQDLVNIKSTSNKSEQDVVRTNQLNDAQVAQESNSLSAMRQEAGL